MIILLLGIAGLMLLVQGKSLEEASRTTKGIYVFMLVTGFYYTLIGSQMGEPLLHPTRWIGQLYMPIGERLYDWLGFVFFR
ncbi:hypothetical protein GTO91_00580 [Heliobacterium undosum]|uniref:Uncharacterized protein n=1 Tax=Heliomicrobium undosum TaxID=121734 RepID=A0A845L1C1_9FIRM|nr:hypothetical protein [Heliomicrobium undosum]MZP28220.1 hypothetical protein [Heliomicrobium undosum]